LKNKRKKLQQRTEKTERSEDREKEVPACSECGISKEFLWTMLELLRPSLSKDDSSDMEIVKIWCHRFRELWKDEL